MKIDGVGAGAGVSKQLDAVIPPRAATKVKHDSEQKSANEDSATQLSKQDRNLLTVSEKTILEAIEKANKSVIGNTRFEFSIHEKTKQIMVKVIDEESNEIIRQVPSEKILDIIAGIWETVGLFVDERR